MKELIAEAKFNYYGFEPAHRDGLVIVKCAKGYSVRPLIWMASLNAYRYLAPAIGEHGTEAAARAAANTQWLAQNDRLRARADKQRALIASLTN